MSPQMARDAVGMMLVSGPKAVFEAVRAELEKMTGEVWYLGEQGDLAAAYKIFGNSMLFVIAAGVADVFAMAKGLGIAAGRRAGGVLEVPAGRRRSSRAARRWRAAISAPASS